MDDTGVQINFDAPAVLRKWPSVNNERVSASLGARPYLIIDGTLDECIRKFMTMPINQHQFRQSHDGPKRRMGVLDKHEGVEWAHRRANIAQQGDAGLDDV